MSYILDALKKAERERHWAKVPTLGTVHARPAIRRQRPWPWIGASVVLLGAATSIWFLRPPVTPSVGRSADSTSVPARSAPPVEHPAPANPAVAAATPEEPTTPHGRVFAPPAAQPEPTRKAAPPTPAHGASSMALPPLAPKAEPSKPEPARASTALASPRGPQNPAVPTPARPVPAPLTATVPAGPTAPAASSTKPAPPGAAPSLPTVQDMAPADRETMPKLTLQFLVYSDVPSERLVFINDKKYLEGQSIDGKVLVEAIRPNGALLRYQGKRFMLSQ